MAILESLGLMGTDPEEQLRRRMIPSLRPDQFGPPGRLSVIGRPRIPEIGAAATSETPAVSMRQLGSSDSLLGIDGSPYARLTETDSPARTAEQARNAPILGRHDNEPSDSILGRVAELRPRIPDASANTTLPEAPILGTSSASLEPAGGLGILGAQPQPPRLGFKERQALPTTSAGAPAGSAAFYQNAIERIEDQKANPWGSPENHPGTLGRIGHILGRIGNIAGDVTGYSAAIPGSDLNRQLRESRLEDRFETASNRENRATETEEQRRIEERRNEVLDRRNDILEGKQPRLTPDESAIADLQKQINPKTGRPYTAYEARVKLAQDIQDTKPAGHTSPFEAFAYGDAQERKAAQDFLDLEKRLGNRYSKPSEFEEKYRLFKEDPETYRAMFGDKSGSGVDRNTATRMLNYFDRRRREVNQDFTLDETQKQEQLRDIENLEKPFLAAVQPGAGGGAGGRTGDRVEVISPNGQRGTIPRSQLDRAKKKGYRVAQ